MSANSISSEDLAVCADMARAGERDRWLAAQLAPPAARHALAVLYAFASELSRTRDAVTEPMMGRIRLQWWRETVEAAAEGKAGAQPVAAALQVLLAQGGVSDADLMALIDAREMDMEDDAFATLEDFLRYVDATSGALNRLALRVLSEEDKATDEAARRIGRAYGLIGHLRAAAVNAANGRVVLPSAFLGGYGISRGALLAGRPGTGMTDAARVLGHMAAGELAAARSLRRDVPRAALPVTALARFCDAYLRRLAKRDWNLFGSDTEPAPVAAPVAVLRAALSGRY